MTPWNSHTVGGGIKSAIFFICMRRRNIEIHREKERKTNRRKNAQSISLFSQLKKYIFINIKNYIGWLVGFL